MTYPPSEPIGYQDGAPKPIALRGLLMEISLPYLVRAANDLDHQAKHHPLVKDARIVDQGPNWFLLHWHCMYRIGPYFRFIEWEEINEWLHQAHNSRMNFRMLKGPFKYYVGGIDWGRYLPTISTYSLLMHYHTGIWDGEGSPLLHQVLRKFLMEFWWWRIRCTEWVARQQYKEEAEVVREQLKHEGEEELYLRMTAYEEYNQKLKREREKQRKEEGLKLFYGYLPPLRLSLHPEEFEEFMQSVAEKKEKEKIKEEIKKQRMEMKHHRRNVPPPPLRRKS